MILNGGSMEFRLPELHQNLANQSFLLVFLIWLIKEVEGEEKQRENSDLHFMRPR